MGYSEQFQAYRERRGLTREQLALRASCHRNTVMNVECGRPVRFATIIHLMGHLGYARDSAEVKQLALQWLEAVSGLRLDESISAERGSVLESLSFGAGEPIGLRLSRSDVELLSFAARNRKVLHALRAIRELVDDTTRSQPT